MSITKENYEAYYLDYLENNLSEKERIAFELFLNENPELKEKPFTIEPLNLEENYTLSIETLSELKVFDDEEEINAATIENYIIAYTEACLSTEKQKEIEHYLLVHPEHQSVLKTYQSLRLSPDLNKQFKLKKQLKKGQIQNLYWFVTTSAAMLFCVFFLLPEKPSILEAKNTKNNITKTKESSKSRSKNNIQEVIKTETTVTYIAHRSTNNHTKNHLKNLSIIGIDSIPNTYFQTILPITNQELEISQQVVPVLLDITNQKFSQTNQSITEPNVNHSISYSKMNSPIKMVTQFLPKKFQEIIDFRYAKATETKQGGIYIKLGKFEYSKTIKTDIDFASNQ